MDKKQKVQSVEITDIAVEGKGVGKKDNFVYFVYNTIPGDIVDIEIIKKKNNFAEAYPISFIKKSEFRQQHFCRHFGYCGGCAWQNISYNNQLEFKQKIVLDNFTRIAKVKPGKIYDIIGAQNTIYYRNKLEFTFSSRKWFVEPPKEGKINDSRALGFHLPKMFDRVLDIDKCFLQSELSNKIRNQIREFAKEKNYEFYDTRNNSGFLRNLIIRKSFAKNQYMVVLIFGYNDEQKINLLCDFVVKNFPEVSTIVYAINSKSNDSINDLSFTTFSGQGFIEEKLINRSFRIGPKSFFQTNSQQAEVLFQRLIELAEFNGNELVYDLYTGAGTIALLISSYVSQVIGIESIDTAVEDAKVNCEINKIKNIIFLRGIVEKEVDRNFAQKYGFPDVIIVDPPRAGLHPNAIKAILNLSPKKVIYVSCNPSTQARDVSMLSESYVLKLIQPVDMFPHTFHVENIAVLEKK